MESFAEEKVENPSACLSVFLRASAFKPGVSTYANGLLVIPFTTSLILLAPILRSRLPPVVGQRLLCLDEDFEDGLSLFGLELCKLRFVVFSREDVVEFLEDDRFDRL